jgi:hypothetical protein
MFLNARAGKIGAGSLQTGYSRGFLCLEVLAWRGLPGRENYCSAGFQPVKTIIARACSPCDHGQDGRATDWHEATARPVPSDLW